MIIESLCRFPATNGKRAAKAEHAMRKVLCDFRAELRWITVAALLMQLIPLAIPLTLHRWLPLLLDPSSSQRSTSLLFVASLLAIVAILRASANYYFLRKSGEVGHRVVARMRQLAHAHLMRLPVGYLEQRGAGKTLLRFIGDADAFRSWFSKTGPKLIADLVTVLLVFAALLFLSWQLTLVLTLPLLAFAFTIIGFSKRIREQTRFARRRQAELTGLVEGHLSNIRQTKIADAFRETRKEVDTLLNEVADNNAQRDRSAAALEAAAQLAILSAIPLLLLVGFPFVWQGRISAEDFIAHVWLTLHLVVTLRLSLSAVVIHQKALVSVQRLYALLSRPAERGRGKRNNKPNYKRLAVVHDGREHSFRRGFQWLPEWIDVGRFYAELNGFERKNELAITLDGLPIAQIDVKQRRRRIGQLNGKGATTFSDLQSMPQGLRATKLRIALLEASSHTHATELLATLGDLLDERAIIVCRRIKESSNMHPQPTNRQYSEA